MSTPAAPVENPDSHYYMCNVTPEHDPHAKPTLMCLCFHHYIMAANSLMIRRVIHVKSEGQCKFCN